MDVLTALDLHVGSSTMSPDGSVKRHRTDDAPDKFASCVGDLTTQVQKHNK